jgi:hypothetical protein
MGLLDDAIREHLDLKRRRGADPAEVERLEREALGPVRRGGFEHEEDVLRADHPAGVAYDLDESYEAEAHGGALHGDTEEGYPADVDYPDGAEYPAEHEYAADTSAGAAYPGEAEPDWVEPGEDQPVIDDAPEFGPPEPPSHTPPTGGESAASAPPVQPADPAPEAAPPPAPPRHHEIAEAWDAHGTIHDEAKPHPPAPAGPVPPSGGSLDEETAEYDVEAAEDEGEADDMLEETPDFLQDTPDHDRLWFEQRPPRDFDFGK